MHFTYGKQLGSVESCDRSDSLQNDGAATTSTSKEDCLGCRERQARRAAEAAFGRRGLFDIVALMGQYLTVAALLSLFEVPSPG